MTALPQSLGAAGRDLQRILVEFGEVIERLDELEVIEHGRELAQKMARDRAMADVAALQLDAGEELLKAHLATSRQMGARLTARVGSRREASALIDRGLGQVAAFSDARIRAVIRRTGTVAAALQHELDVRVFGRRVDQRADEVGVVLGGGIERKLVERLWDGKVGRPGQLGQLFLAKVDRAAVLSAGYEETAARLKAEVDRLLSLGHSARTATAALQRASFSLEGYAKWVDQLAAAGRGAIQGDAGARKGFQALLRTAKRYVQRRGATEVALSTRGASAKLVRSIEKAVLDLSEQAIQSAVTRWVAKKANYEAITMMRTVTNETYRAQAQLGMIERPWIYAVEWRLSLSHPRIDVCNAMASADLGLGPGHYFIGHIPTAHPSCLCRIEPVIDQDFFKRDGRPLAWTPPSDYGRNLDALAFHGAFAAAANGAKTPAELRDRMARGGLLAQTPAKLDRVSPRKATPANLLRTRIEASMKREVLGAL